MDGLHNPRDRDQVIGRKTQRKRLRRGPTYKASKTGFGCGHLKYPRNVLEGRVQRSWTVEDWKVLSQRSFSVKDQSWPQKRCSGFFHRVLLPHPTLESLPLLFYILFHFLSFFLNSYCSSLSLPYCSFILATMPSTILIISLVLFIFLYYFWFWLLTFFGWSLNIKC